jgi:hypothetical protein
MSRKSRRSFIGLPDAIRFLLPEAEKSFSTGTPDTANNLRVTIRTYSTEGMWGRVTASRNLLVPVVIMTVLVLNAVAAAPSPTKPPFSVVISTEQTEIKSGSAITVKVTLTNTSERVIALEMMDVSPLVAVVRGADGILSPETEYGRILKQKQRERANPNMTGGPRVGFKLEPGEPVVEECVVSNLYDMSRPGQYSIQFERIWHGTGVPSNIIKIKVIP